MSSNTLVNMRVDSRLSTANPASDYNIYLKQQNDIKEQQQKQQQQQHSFPNQHHYENQHQPSRPQEINRRYQPNYPRHPSPLSSDDSSNSTSSNSSDSSASSRSSSQEQLPEPVRHSLVDNPVKPPPPRQPVHKSKLSMQYTPSESGDSDDEPLSLPQPDKKFGFMTGRPVELNSSRAINVVPREDASQAVMNSSPSVNEGADTASQKPEKKKASIVKRISNLFGGSKKSKKASRISAPAAMPDAAQNKNDRSQSSSATVKSLQISTEHPNDSKTDLQPPTGTFNHKRSWSFSDTRRGSSSNNSSTDALNTIGAGNPIRNSVVQESRDRKFRDSGFEDSEGLGHRRYSSTASAIGASRPLSSYPYQKPPLLGGDVSLNDQQQYQSRFASQTQFQPSQTQFLSYPPGFEAENSGRASPRLGLINEEGSRKITLEELASLEPPPRVVDMSARRSSTASVPETLVSRIDREKSTVCFQAPIPKLDTYSRDINLDPALSNLVQLHRRDYYTNARLGGTPPPAPQVPQQQMQMPLPISLDPTGKDRGNPSKKDVAASLIGFNSPYQYPVNSNHPLAAPSIPQSDLANRRHSVNLTQLQTQVPNSFPTGPRFSTSASNINLLNAAAMASAKQQQQEQLQLATPQITPPTGINGGSLGRNQASPTRQSSMNYFNLPQQHQSQPQMDPSPTMLSPGLGATSSANTYNHELSVAMQIQQQQIAQQQQQTQQQIDQIRLQQQMLQQNQQLQQQLELARAVMAATPPADGMTGSMSPNQQAIIGNIPVQFTTPVLTSPMGLGMGMGMGMGVNPQNMRVNMMSMGVGTLGGYGQATTPMLTQGMVPQLIMSPQMGPQLMAIPATSLYTYQQQPHLTTMVSTAAVANGGKPA